MKFILQISTLLIVTILIASCSKDDSSNGNCDFVGDWTAISGYINTSGDTISEGWADETFTNIIYFEEEPYLSEIKSIVVDNEFEEKLFLGGIVIEVEEDGDVFVPFSVGFDNYEPTEDCTEIESSVNDPSTGGAVRLKQRFDFLSDDLALITVHNAIGPTLSLRK